MLSTSPLPALLSAQEENCLTKDVVVNLRTDLYRDAV